MRRLCDDGLILTEWFRAAAEGSPLSHLQSLCTEVRPSLSRKSFFDAINLNSQIMHLYQCMLLHAVSISISHRHVLSQGSTNVSVCTMNDILCCSCA